MTQFVRFPHIPHLVWLGRGAPRDDKLMSSEEADKLLSGEVIVEEKVDGANLGISRGSDGKLLIQNRGQYLSEPYLGQFSRLDGWLALYGRKLSTIVNNSIILFGEWCAAKHSLNYEALPDWFLLFDVYDRENKLFWSTVRRNAIADSLEMAVVAELYRGPTTLANLKQIVTKHRSVYRKGPLEGVVIRRDSREWCEGRAKLVRPEFTQAIGEHWKKRAIVWNSVSYLSSDAD